MDQTENPVWKSWPMSHGVLVSPLACRSATTMSISRWAGPILS
ncbi:hypothetical protein [Streptomyces sp. NPDC056081]